MHLNSLQANFYDYDGGGITAQDIYDVIPTTAESATRIVDDQGQIVTAEKAQVIRLLDMFLLGPAMIYAGLGKDLPQGLKAMMFLTGVGTIIYNGHNWWQNQAAQKGGDI